VAWPPRSRLLLSPKNGHLLNMEVMCRRPEVVAVVRF